NGDGWTVRRFTPQPRPSLRQRAWDALGRIVGEGPHRETWRYVRRRFHSRRSYLNSRQRWPDPDVVRFRPELHRWFRGCGIELMFYLVHERLSFECGIPYVIVVHDLQHRLHPEFPEVSADGEWERREYSYRNGVRYATLLIADSESGKDDILDFYRPYGV